MTFFSLFYVLERVENEFLRVLISIINVKVGLINEEKKELEKMKMRKAEFKYKLVLTEKNDEILG
ncbi:hypothetical protein BU025_10590 [Staphylococcus simulans]|nr:hypothetical protein BU025_10590 [Staphylococcus simulans]